MIVYPWYEGWHWESKRYTVKLAGLILASLLAVYIWHDSTNDILMLLPSVPLVYALVEVIVYNRIHPRVKATRGEDPADIHAVDCAITKYYVCTPGTAVLNGSLLTLRPASGSTVVVDLNDVIVVRKAHWFSHSLYLTKTEFTLYFPGGKSVGFAVANTIARCWRPALQKKRPLQQADVA